MIGIYKITSPIGDIYIGQTKNFLQRLEDHKSRKNKKSKRLNESIAKHGLKNHTITFIEECSEEDLNCRERYWQDFYDVLGEKGLNSVLTKCNDLKGETLDNIKEDRRLRQQGQNNSFYGKTHTDEVKEKIKLANLGVNNHNYGKKLTDEQKDNIRNHRLNSSHTQETIEKLRQLSSRGNNPRAKKVIDKTSLKIWGCIKDCAEELDIKYSTLFNQLKGKQKNTTNIIYLSDYENSL